MESNAIKTIISQIIEESGENGITEGQVTNELVTKYKMGYYEALETLRNVYKDVGAERTPEHTGSVIFYRKKKQQKGPDESAAIRLAKMSARQNMGERGRMDILKHYRR